uniref:Uncharacterized protein n=1 Tax=Acrobeloides nanus TaxID=290746 RepID=A0A914ELI6_9BILA
MRDQFMASVTGVATSGEAMYRCNRFMCYYNYLMRLPLDAVKNCMDYDVFNNHSNWYWNPNNNWMAPFIFVVESDKIKEDYKILRNLHDTSWPFDQYHLVMNMAISGWASNYIKHELYDYKIHDKRREERIPVVPTKSTSAPVSVLPQISLTWLLVLSIVIVTFILVVSGIYLWWYLVQKSKDDERAKMVRKEIIVRQNEVNKNTEYDDTNPEFNKDE